MGGLTAGNDAIVRADRLALHFEGGRVKALDGASLEVRRGEFVAITGPSGCGKSSLLQLIGLLDRPTAGEISFESTPYSSVSDESLFRRQHFGFIFQSFHLIPTVTTTDNVMLPTLGCAGTRQSHLARARELLGRLGMGHRMHQFPGELSGGERQRVAIARALINHADVILADEPTGSLDSANAQQVLQLLADIRRERGLTVILVTHDKSVSEQADRTVHMCDGRVVSTSGYGA